MLNYFDQREQGVLDFRLPVLITPNIDQLVKLNRGEHADLKLRLQGASLILPDGQPIVWFSKLKFGRSGLKRRLTGSDFFPQMWAWLKANQYPVTLVVRSQELADMVIRDFPRANCYVPPFFHENDTAALEEVVKNTLKAVQENDSRYLMIGLGFPKQEKIALKIIDEVKVKVPFIFLLGASFEFYFGLKKRAPLFFQKMGLEFLHRFGSEPRRMFKRYFIDDLAFFKLAFKEFFKK